MSFGRLIEMYVEMNAQARTKCGKGAARGVRRGDRVPAVIYGPKNAPMSISVPVRELEKFLVDAGTDARLITLKMDGDGQGARQVMIKEVQIHPVRRKFLHVDFYEVSEDRPIVMDVPIEYIGEPVGIKLGGVLNILRRALSVRCLPDQVPERVSIDLRPLNVGETIHVSDLIGKYPFELVDNKTFAVVTVTGSTEKKSGPGAEA